MSGTNLPDVNSIPSSSVSTMPIPSSLTSDARINKFTAKGHAGKLAELSENEDESSSQHMPLLKRNPPGDTGDPPDSSTPIMSDDGYVEITIADAAAAPEDSTDMCSQPAGTPFIFSLMGWLRSTPSILCKLRRSFWDSGTATMTVAALIMATGALAVAMIDGRVPVFEIVVIRSTVSLMLTMSVVRAEKWTGYFGTKRLWPKLAMRGFVGATSMTLYYEAIDRMPLADAITIMYSNPVLVALLAWALRGEMLSLRGCAGIAVTLLGVVVVAQPPFMFGGHEWSHTRMAGFVMGVMAAATAAVAFFVITCIPKTEPALVVSLWFHAAAIAMSIVPLMVGYPDKVMVPGAFDCGMLTIVILASFFGQMLLNHSFQIQNAAKGSSINCTQVLYAHIFGVTLLNEQETVWGVLGSLLIASGVVTVNSAKAHKSDGASGAFEHPSLLPIFKYKAASTSDTDAVVEKPGKEVPGFPSAADDGSTAEASAAEAGTAERGEGGSGGFLRAAHSRLGLLVGSSFRQPQEASQQLQLAGVENAADGEGGRADGAESSAGRSIHDDSNLKGQSIVGPSPYVYTSLPQREDADVSESQLFLAGSSAIAEGNEKRRTRGPAGGHGSLRDGEKSWVGEWAFRQETEDGRLAPAMARYHQLLERDRQ